MPGYSKTFAQIYNDRWAAFPEQLAPQIMAFYVDTPIGQHNRSMLDVCCGSGQLASYFLEHGFSVTGIDLSEAMLEHAKKNTLKYVQNDQAKYIKADATSFTLDTRFGLIVSTYDALNHLDNFEALQSCFRSVFDVLLDEGVFIFDLNTRAGLMSRWNSISVEETEEMLLLLRGIYDGKGDKATFKFTAFLQTPEGLYTRFEEIVNNTLFEMAAVKSALLECGWRSVHFARSTDLATPIAEPEQEGRAFIVAIK